MIDCSHGSAEWLAPIDPELPLINLEDPDEYVSPESNLGKPEISV
jgi:hypothetical protein